MTLPRRWRLLILLAAALAVAAGGCARPVMVDQKTALERQILGNFERLEDELILASSVRGSADQQRASARLSPLQREALQALLSREFNRDDVDALKAKQLVGEGNDGLLKVLPGPPPGPQVQQLVGQENRDRTVLIRRVIQLDVHLGDKDLGLVKRIFARLMAQTAEPGQRVQLPDGRWHTVVKSAEQGPAAGKAGRGASQQGGATKR